MAVRKKDMKTAKVLMALSLMMAVTSTVQVQAGKTPPPPQPSGVFTFTYNVGTELNYHAYALACQVSSTTPRPAGTVVLGNWWVRDLGPVAGTNTVGCPAPVAVKGQTTAVLGALYFAHVADVGGQPFVHPVVDVQIYTPKLYNGAAIIEVITPTGGGIVLYNGAPFKPFAWNISAYVWDVQPAIWPPL
jgi:hypothetical protein